MMTFLEGLRRKKQIRTGCPDGSGTWRQADHGPVLTVLACPPLTFAPSLTGSGEGRLELSEVRRIDVTVAVVVERMAMLHREDRIAAGQAAIVAVNGHPGLPHGAETLRYFSDISPYRSLGSTRKQP